MICIIAATIRLPLRTRFARHVRPRRPTACNSRQPKLPHCPVLGHPPRESLLRPALRFQVTWEPSLNRRFYLEHHLCASVQLDVAGIGFDDRLLSTTGYHIQEQHNSLNSNHSTAAIAERHGGDWLIRSVGTIRYRRNGIGSGTRRCRRQRHTWCPGGAYSAVS